MTNSNFDNAILLTWVFQGMNEIGILRFNGMLISGLNKIQCTYIHRTTSHVRVFHSVTSNGNNSIFMYRSASYSDWKVIPGVVGFYRESLV